MKMMTIITTIAAGILFIAMGVTVLSSGEQQEDEITSISSYYDSGNQVYGEFPESTKTPNLYNFIWEDPQSFSGDISPFPESLIRLNEVTGDLSCLPKTNKCIYLDKPLTRDLSLLPRVIELECGEDIEWIDQLKFINDPPLTLNYRVVYNPNSKEIVNNYEEPYNDGSKTYVPTHLSGFESDTLEVVERYVEDNNLEYKEEDEELIDLE